jgi:hypothetical protein
VFSNSEAELVLTYSGSDVDIGIPGSKLRQDLAVGLAGGRMSIGAMVYSASLDQGENAGPLLTAASRQLVAAEPNTGMLLVAGGGLCLLAGALKRIPRRRGRDMGRDA